MQREQRMQRSSSSVTRGPSSTFFGFFTLFSRKRESCAAVFDAEFLESAFARLVADRAIERMIDEEKFHHPATAFLDQRRFGANPEPFGDIGRAADLRTRHPVDLRLAVVGEDGFTVRAHFRHAHFDQAHAAVARGGEFLVIAIARHVTAGLLAGFDQARALRELDARRR